MSLVLLTFLLPWLWGGHQKASHNLCASDCRFKYVWHRMEITIWSIGVTYVHKQMVNSKVEDVEPPPPPHIIPSGGLPKGNPNYASKEILNLDHNESSALSKCTNYWATKAGLEKERKREREKQMVPCTSYYTVFIIL